MAVFGSNKEYSILYWIQIHNTGNLWIPIQLNNKKLKNLVFKKKCKWQKEKFFWYEVYTLFLFYILNNKIFIIFDKLVIKIVQYGIIFLVLVFIKKYIFLILINLKLIQGLKNSVCCIWYYVKV